MRAGVWFLHSLCVFGAAAVQGSTYSISVEMVRGWNQTSQALGPCCVPCQAPASKRPAVSSSSDYTKLTYGSIVGAKQVAWYGQILSRGVGAAPSQALAVDTESQSRPVPSVLFELWRPEQDPGFLTSHLSMEELEEGHNPCEAMWTKYTSTGPIWSWVQNFTPDTA